MRAITFQSIGTVTTISMPDPKLESDRDAIIAVAVAGLCGSDLHPFFGREIGIDPGTVMGHEMVGTILDLGSAAAAQSDLKIGDRVFAPFSSNCGRCFFCQSGLTSRCEIGQLFGWRSQGKGLHGFQSEMIRVPLADATLKKVPGGVSDTEALLLGDNFSTGYYCADMSGFKSGGVLAVIGCGTVGQLCLQSLSRLGAETVLAIDPVAERRQLAQRWRAEGIAPEQAESRIKALTGGRGADAVMELVGLPAAQALAYRLLRPGGVMSVIGCHCSPHFSFSPAEAYDKNLTYRTGRCPARMYMDQLTPRVAAGEFDLSGLITHRFGIEDAVEAYDVFSKQRDGCLKAVIELS